MAAIMGNEEMVQILIETGVDINIENKELWQPRSLAHTESIKKFIQDHPGSKQFKKILFDVY